ncbi:MAG: DUF3575 domain-containing protein [Mucinivorans sp.]
MALMTKRLFLIFVLGLYSYFAFAAPPIDQSTMAEKVETDRRLEPIKNKKIDALPQVAYSSLDTTTSGRRKIARLSMPRNDEWKTNGESRFGLKANVAMMALLAPNAEAEYFVADKWSIVADFQMAWWDHAAHHRYYRFMIAGPEARYWFASKKRFQGHFVGVYAMVGLFEFMFKPDFGIQSDFCWSAGFTYGYQLPATKWLTLEFSLGLGYLTADYRQYYHDVDCYVYEQTQRLTYFGPTKLKISLVFPLRSRYKK